MSLAKWQKAIFALAEGGVSAAAANKWQQIPTNFILQEVEMPIKTAKGVAAKDMNYVDCKTIKLSL